MPPTLCLQALEHQIQPDSQLKPQQFTLSEHADAAGMGAVHGSSTCAYSPSTSSLGKRALSLFPASKAVTNHEKKAMQSAPITKSPVLCLIHQPADSRPLSVRRSEGPTPGRHPPTRRYSCCVRTHKAVQMAPVAVVPRRPAFCEQRHREDVHGDVLQHNDSASSAHSDPLHSTTDCW